MPDELDYMLHRYEQPCLSIYVPFYVGTVKVDPDFSIPEVGGKFLTISRLATMRTPSLHRQSEKFNPHISGTE